MQVTTKLSAIDLLISQYKQLMVKLDVLCHESNSDSRSTLGTGLYRGFFVCVCFGGIF